MLEQKNSIKDVIVIEGVIHFAIQARSQIEITNTKKKDTNGEDLVDNIENLAIEGHLSPNKIETTKENHEK